jgi:uncharacterized protein
MAAKKSANRGTKPATTAANARSAKIARAPKRATKRAPAPAKKRRAAKAKTLAATPAIIHWEIQAQDAARVQRFYADLFGWKIDAANPMNYGMVSSKGAAGINGGIGGTSGGSRLLVYATVADINRVLAKAEALGAKTILPRTNVGPVIMGIFEDLEGNHFGILEG